MHSTKLKRGHLWPCEDFFNHEMWGKIANVIKYSKLTRVRNDTLDLMSALGKIMEKLIRALNNRDSKEEKYSKC